MTRARLAARLQLHSWRANVMMTPNKRVAGMLALSRFGGVPVYFTLKSRCAGVFHRTVSSAE